MIAFERINARNLHLLDSFERTPDPPHWVNEVEEIAYGPGAAAAILDDEVVGWLIYDDEDLIGVAIHRPESATRHAELLHIVCVRYAERNKHRGRALLERLLPHVRAHSDFDYVVWLVHPDNSPMNTVSANVTDDPPQVDRRGNLLYVWP